MSVKPSETKTIKNLQDEAKKVVLAASSRWIDVIFQEELCNTDRNEYISAADYFRESVSELFALNKLAKIVNKQS